MLRSSWRRYAKIAGLTVLTLSAAVFVFVWGATLGQVSGYYSAQSKGYASQYPSDTDNRITKCFTDSNLATAKQCAQEAITADRENQRSEQDLQAQREVADWTYYVLVISIVQIPLGVFGLIALLVTIGQGREANEIARNSAKLQSRCYLSVSSIEVLEPRKINVPVANQREQRVLCAEVYLGFANNGETPATVNQLYIDFIWFTNPLGRQMLRVEKTTDFVVHRGVPVTIPFPIRADAADLNEIGQLFAFISTRYTDVFDDEHTEAFCYQFGENCGFYDMDFPFHMSAHSVDEYITMLQDSDSDQRKQEAV